MISHRERRMLHVDGTLVWPKGSGGHFIMGQITGSYDVSDPSTNEHKAGDLLWLYLEEHANDGTPMHMLENKADAWYGNIMSTRRQDGTWPYRYAGAHVMPTMTDRLIDFHTDEMAVITIDVRDTALISLLALIKNLLSPAWAALPYKVTQLVNHARRLQHDIDLEAYGNDMSRLVNSIWELELCPRDIDISRTLFGWRYYIACACQGMDPLDIGNLRQHLSRRYDDLHRDTEASCYMVATGMGVDAVYVRYADLFFDLRIPNSRMFSKVHGQSLRRYSMRNLELAARFARLLPGDRAGEIASTISLARSRLDNA